MVALHDPTAETPPWAREEIRFQRLLADATERVTRHWVATGEMTPAEAALPQVQRAVLGRVAPTRGEPVISMVLLLATWVCAFGCAWEAHGERYGSALVLAATGIMSCLMMFG